MRIVFNLLPRFNLSLRSKLGKSPVPYSQLRDAGARGSRPVTSPGPIISSNKEASFFR